MPSSAINTLTVADVAIDSRTAGTRAVYTYQVVGPDKPCPGQAFIVPLGPRRAIGFVLEVRDTEPAELSFAAEALKPLGARVEGLDLPPVTLELVHEVARQTLSPVPAALSLTVPPAVRERLVNTWKARNARGAVPMLSAPQGEALRTLREHGAVEDSKAKPLTDGVKRTLRSLEKLGLAEQTISVSPQTERRRMTGLFHLTPDRERVEQFLTGAGKKKPAQSVTVMRLQGSETADFTPQEIKTLAGVTDQTVRALVQSGLLEPQEPGLAKAKQRPNLTASQALAVNAVLDAIKAARHEAFLLFGVTGSGKTEVYLRCAEEALRHGRQVAYLVPEIALTAQVIAQLRERFGDQVAVIHSGMPPSERLDNWVRIRSGQCAVVLGARSALFAPLANLGLVIVDEEHEASYKQDSSPRYQTKSLASWLAQRSRCPVVFGSATPSLETFYAAQHGGPTLLRLPERAASARLPEVEVADLAALYRDRRPSLLAPQLDSLIQEALGRREQAILFLNRRAYAPFLVCRDCGHRFTCRQCAVSLAFHRRERRIKCHLCGHQERVPETCPDCGGGRVAPFGTGTEKVEEAVSAMYPSARVARLDRDVARRRGALEETLAAFRSGSLDILVGTQMVAKGLDFPNVTVVGVVAADVSLNVPDFRSAERTFQLLSQVAGRAGRGRSPGRVVVQTLMPSNPAILAAQAHDYEGFYSAELEQRREARYPPFVRLVLLLVTGPDRTDVHGLSALAAQRLRLALPEGEVLGPADCPIERLQNLWRRHVLVKLPNCSDPAPVAAAVEGLKSGKARITIDVDPVSLA